MRGLIVLAICVILGGCAAGGAIDYLHTEYGSAQRDGTVDLSDDPMQQQMYQIWLNKSKPKIMVETSLSTAAGAGIARGLTMGAVEGGPLRPAFERAALKYLADNKSPDCKVSNPLRLADVAWEFDYDCAEPSTTQKKKQRK